MGKISRRVLMKRLTILAFALLSVIVSNAQTIDITYSGSSAVVNIPAGVTDVIPTISGAHVSIASTTTTTEYTYHVKGTTTNGSLTISGNYKMTLKLDGVNIKSANGAAIDIECGKRIAVVLANGTENTLEDCAGGTQKAAMYFAGHPEFEGGGMLNVTGNTAHAISAKEYLQLKKGMGTINILGAVKDGIHCGKGKVSAWDETMISNENEFFFCNGGVVNISNVGGDCIDAGDYGCVYIKGGSINLDITAPDACGIKCKNTFIMDGGFINIDISGQDSDGIKFSNNARFNKGTVDIYVSGNGSKGIKGNLDNILYPKCANATIGADADISIIACGANVTKKENPEDPSHCVALSIDGNLSVAGVDNVHIIAAGGIARALTCDGTCTGNMVLKEYLWYAHPNNFKNSMSVYAIVKDFAPEDYEGYEIGAFVGDECRGTLSYYAEGYGYMRVYSNDGEAGKLTFKAYNRETGEIKEFGNDEVVLRNDGMAGTPAEPIVLRFDSELLLGDVNNDGKLTIADLVSIIRILNGKTAGLNLDAADYDQNGTIEKADANKLAVDLTK